MLVAEANIRISNSGEATGLRLEHDDVRRLFDNLVLGYRKEQNISTFLGKYTKKWIFFQFLNRS